MRTGRGVLPAFGGLVALYLTIPVIAFLVRLARSNNPGFHAPGLWSAAVVSVISATISLGLICTFGVPLAYVLARSHGRLARVVGVTVQIPLALPPLMGGILLVYVVGPYSWAGRLFGGHLTESIAGVVLAQSFVAAPFLIGVAKAAFADVDPSLYDVAATLGLGSFAQFSRVGVPAAKRGIRAGMILAWLRAFGEYGATVIIAFHPYSLPIFTDLQFGGGGLTNTEAPTAIAIAIAIAAIALGELRFPRRHPRERTLANPVEPKLRTPTSIAFHFDLCVGSFHLDVSYRSTTSRVAVLGPSGSGKSLTLRCLAGVLGPDGGSLDLLDRDGIQVGVRAPSIGYVPQSLGLFPHLRVRDQIVFGVGADPARASYWSSRLGVDRLLDRTPEALSGGERQRVSLVRMLARDPDLLLLDEPFSSLDAPVRTALRLDLRSLQRESGAPSVIVTHDPEEAAMLADEILVIFAGRVLQSGTTRSVFERPASVEVARVLGVENIFSGRSTGRGLIDTDGVTIATQVDYPPGTTVSWGIRVEDVSLSATGIPGVVRDVIDRGVTYDALVELAPAVIVRLRCTSTTPALGEVVRVDFRSDAISVWNRPSLVDGN